MTGLRFSAQLCVLQFCTSVLRILCLAAHATRCGVAERPHPATGGLRPRAGMDEPHFEPRDKEVDPRMMTFRLLLGAALLPAVSSTAQQSHVGSGNPPEKNAASVAQVARRLTVDDVLAMAQAGLSEDLIVARLRRDGTPFDLTTEDMIRLKRANLGDNVIKVMIDPKAEIKAGASATQNSQSVAISPLALPAGAIPSGAAPSGISAPAGDPNDPLTPHDSGIYLIKKDQNGQTLVVLERAAYQGAKTGTAGLMLTGGLKKAKTKAVIAGPRASIRADANPVFYFYFDDKAAGLGKGYFGANLSNPNQFALIKLEDAKSNRETVIMEANVFGASSGTNEKSMIGFRAERIRPGLYRVTVNNPLAPGEYCFLASVGGMGAFGAGAAGAAEIFDFGVNPNQ
jgi:hypothetical protein